MPALKPSNETPNPATRTFDIQASPLKCLQAILGLKLHRRQSTKAAQVHDCHHAWP
jgi:hypothetical protein